MTTQGAKIRVCSACKRRTCYQGIYPCHEEHLHSSPSVELDVETLLVYNREHPSWWNTTGKQTAQGRVQIERLRKMREQLEGK